MNERELPNTTAVLILGIVSVIGCCCYGIFGIIAGIVALVLAKKDQALYDMNPQLYTNYSNLKTGKILAIIGLVLSSLSLISSIIYFILFATTGFGSGNPDEMIRQLEELFKSR